MQNVKLLSSAGSVHPSFELTHSDCQFIRHAPKVVLTIRQENGLTKQRFICDSIDDAVTFWNNNRNRF